MDIGVQMIFQKWGYGDDMSDARIYDEEIALGVLADELGFDALWPVEHHFEDYSFCPDNMQFLSYMAGITKRIKLGTGAVILPWHHPMRVAEKISMLDHCCGGRTIFGMGRGLSRKEYEPFQIDMGSSRERFDEAAKMILGALETGYIQGDGPYYPQPRTRIRPAPRRSFAGRTTAVAMSPDSAEAAAQIGVKMVVFSQMAWDDQAKAFDKFRADFRAAQGRDAPSPMVCDFTFCHEDAETAETVSHDHVTGYLASVMDHYELASDHYKQTKGYEMYASNVDIIKAMGLEKMAKRYLGIQAWGTPQQILEKLEYRRRMVGDFDLTLCFRYAGLAYEEVEASMRLFASEVMPELKSWGPVADAA